MVVEEEVGMEEGMCPGRGIYEGEEGGREGGVYW